MTDKTTEALEALDRCGQRLNRVPTEDRIAFQAEFAKVREALDEAFEAPKQPAPKAKRTRAKSPTQDAEQQIKESMAAKAAAAQKAEAAKSK